jgi:Tfp pilus assembly protein PilP
MNPACSATVRKGLTPLWPPLSGEGGSVLMTVLLLTLCACTGDMNDLRAYAQEVKSQRYGEIEPLPEIKPHETYAYQASQLRDPFDPLLFRGPTTGVSQSNNGIRPDITRPRELLEDFPLDTLRMVGTLAQRNQVWALIRVSDGTIHRVQEGNYMGQNHGKIFGISEEMVELTEIIPDGLGGWRKRDASLALSE